MKNEISLRLLISIEIIFGFGAIGVDFLTTSLESIDYQKFSASELTAFDSYPFIVVPAFILLIAGMAISWIGLWFMWKPSRILYSITWAIGLAFAPFLGPSYWTSWASPLENISVLAAGAILSLIYFSELRYRFQKTNTAEQGAAANP